MHQPPFDLALSTLGVSPAMKPRRVFERAAGAGFRAIMLDSARAGVRPRELDRSARRGLASLLRRLELRLAGAELWIPPEHYAAPVTSERALSSALSSIDLLAELADLIPAARTLTLSLPADGADEAVATIADAANRAEVTIANAARPGREGAAGAPIGVALDPWAIRALGGDPIAIMTARHEAPDAARWPFSTRRPEETLDPFGYASALSVVGFRGDVALDLRDAIDPEADAVSALARWRQADPFPF